MNGDRVTEATGYISDLRLRWKNGRPYLDVRLTLDHIDNLEQLHQQSASAVAISFTTTNELRDLFAAP